jgi:hypothetical protein
MTKKKTIQVEDNIDLVRDVASGAIINTNKNAYEARLARIEKAKLDEQQTADIEVLKKDMAEIKSLLKKMASK